MLNVDQNQGKTKDFEEDLLLDCAAMLNYKQQFQSIDLSLPPLSLLDIQHIL